MNQRAEVAGKSPATNGERGVSTAALVAFSAPGFGTGLMGGAIVGILPTIYGTYYGIELAFIGLVLLVGRAVDAILDPLIGYLSDRTRLRLGRRRSWILAGVVLFTVSAHALLSPPAAPGQAYVLGWYVLFFVSWAMIEIPHAAWAAELSRDAGTRTRIMTCRQVVASLGAVTFALTPMVLGVQGGEMSPAVLDALGKAILVLMPLLGVIAVLPVADKAVGSLQRIQSPLEVLAAVRRNKPFLMFVGVFLIAGLGYGMYGGLYFLYIQTYLGIGSSISIILVVMVVATTVSLPLWMFVINRIGKLRAWALGLSLIACMSIGMALIEPGPAASTWYIALLLVMGLCAGTNSVVPYALLADVVDYDAMKSGEERAGSYFSMLMLILKINFAAGTGLGFMLLQAFGYDATASEHSTGAILALKACALVVPAILMLISAVWVLRFPLDERRHAIVRRWLERRERRRPPMAGLPETSR